MESNHNTCELCEKDADCLSNNGVLCSECTVTLAYRSFRRTCCFCGKRAAYADDDWMCKTCLIADCQRTYDRRFNQ